MGGWKLEVFKMMIYMAFPVGIFHYFHQPEYYEDWVISVKRDLYPPDNLAHREMLEKVKNNMRIKEELEMLKALENN